MIGHKFFIVNYWPEGLKILPLLANNVGSLKKWGIRPHTLALTISVDLS